METVRDRLKSLLIILLEVISTGDGGVRLDRKRFEDQISAAGYDESDISDLLDWLEDEWLSQGPLSWRSTDMADLDHVRGARLLGEDEREYLSPAAFGYLMKLFREGQITRRQMESLVQYASLVSDGPMDRDGMARLVDQVFFLIPTERPLSLPIDGFGNIH